MDRKLASREQDVAARAAATAGGSSGAGQALVLAAQRRREQPWPGAGPHGDARRDPETGGGEQGAEGRTQQPGGCGCRGRGKPVCEPEEERISAGPGGAVQR